MDRHDDGRRPRILASGLSFFAIHGLVQPDRPAGNRLTALGMQRHTRWHCDLSDLSSARRPLRRRGDALPPCWAAREGTTVVRSQATDYWVSVSRSSPPPPLSQPRRLHGIGIDRATPSALRRVPWAPSRKPAWHVRPVAFELVFEDLRQREGWALLTLTSAREVRPRG